MGQTKDPEDGAAVAASIFIAVAVYGVCQTSKSKVIFPVELILFFPTGFPYILRPASLSEYPEQSTGSDITAVKA